MALRYPAPLLTPGVADFVRNGGRFALERRPIYSGIRSDDNYKNLESVLSRHQYAKIEVVNIHGAFADVVGRILSGLVAKLAPSFFFIDPFGFGGVPFATIKEILSIPRTEVFITFMYRDVNRFFETPAAQAALHELFGTEVSEQLNRVSGSREHSLRDLYVKQLRDVAKVKYV